MRNEPSALSILQFMRNKLSVLSVQLGWEWWTVVSILRIPERGVGPCPIDPFIDPSIDPLSDPPLVPFVAALGARLRFRVVI